MSEPTKENVVPVTPPAEPVVPPAVPPVSQDAIKDELDKIKKPKTEAEKAAFSLQMTAKRLQELGLDPMKVLGVDTPKTKDDDTSEEDDRPVTFGDLKRINGDNTAKTALSLCDSITNEAERELTKHYIQNTIKSSGDPQKDFNNARGLVNVLKNKQILDEIARGGDAKPAGSGAGAPAKPADGVFTPTSDERSFMGPPFNLTQAEIIANRKKEKEQE